MYAPSRISIYVIVKGYWLQHARICLLSSISLPLTYPAYFQDLILEHSSSRTPCTFLIWTLTSGGNSVKVFVTLFYYWDMIGFWLQTCGMQSTIGLYPTKEMKFLQEISTLLLLLMTGLLSLEEDVRMLGCAELNFEILCHFSKL